MKPKLGDLVMIYYNDHTGSVDEGGTVVNKAVGWVHEINEESSPASIILAQDMSEYGDTSFPFTTIITSDIVKIKRVRESK